MCCKTLGSCMASCSMHAQQSPMGTATSQVSSACWAHVQENPSCHTAPIRLSWLTYYGGLTPSPLAQSLAQSSHLPPPQTPKLSLMLALASVSPSPSAVTGMLGIFSQAGKPEMAKKTLDGPRQLLLSSSCVPSLLWITLDHAQSSMGTTQALSKVGKAGATTIAPPTLSSGKSMLFFTPFPTTFTSTPGTS